MRILHVGKFFPPHPGGMEVFLADLIDAQHRQGLDAHALVHGTPLPSDPPWLQRVPVQAHLSYAPIALGFRRALRRAIARLRPDVLHLHLPNNSALWLLTLPSARSIPWVIHWHSDVVDARFSTAVALAYRLYRPFEQAQLERAEHIIATSPPYLAASTALQAWHDKTSVVPLGIRLPPAAPTQAAPAQDNIALPWRAGVLRLLSVGRLTYYKGFETLIEAVAGLPGVELAIVGAGEEHAALLAHIQACTPAGEVPRTQLLGAVDNERKTALLRACDVFCLASCERTEAFGIAVLEAMQQARPCLVSNLPGSGLPWVVEQAGAGMSVALQDVAAWRTAISSLQADPALRARLGAAGQEALPRLFGIDACATRILALYGSVQPDQPSAPYPMASYTNAAPQQSDTLIVIPARDEASTIGAVVQGLRAAGWHEVLVINDHSRDATAEIARGAGARVLEPTLPLGAWGGMQAGIRYALRQGYRYAITMDADGQHEVAEIPALLAAATQADLVVGAYPERASRLRQWAWHWFRHLAGFELRDLTSGFRLYNRAAMQVLASREASLLDYQDLGALLLIRRCGLHIAEVPVSMNLRSAGKSRIFHSWLSVAKYMAATTLLCLARWEPPGERRSQAPPKQQPKRP